MILLLLAGLLTLGVLAALLIPFLRVHAAPPPAERFNAAVYRQQLAELDADVGRDVLPEGEAAGARVEIERRLLAAARRDTADATPPTRAPTWAAAAIAGVLILAASALYAVVGRPNLPDQPFTGDRTLGTAAPTAQEAPGQTAGGAAPGDPNRAEFEQLLAQLKSRLAQNAGDAKGWLLLARGEMRLDHAADAVDAYDHALALPGGGDLSVVGEAAEARVVAAGGQVDAGAKAAFQKVHTAQPKAPQPRFYLALAKAQAGDTAGALADWRALAADSPSDAPYLPALNARIAQAERPSAAPPGPTGEQVAAASALPEAQQRAMVEGMVSGLAAKLKADTNNVEGWRRLARAETVLSHPKEAADAWRQVLRLDPTDADAKAALSQ